MPTEIKYTTRFRKQYKRADQTIKIAFGHVLELFLEDPNHLALRNHSLREKFAGYRSRDVTEDWRAIYREEKDRILFITLGTHKELYG